MFVEASDIQLRRPRSLRYEPGVRYLIVAIALAGCSGSPKCGDGVTASQLTIQSADMTVVVTTHPYSLTVLDANGNPLVADGALGWTSGTMLAPDMMELCYMARLTADRVASCTVLTKQ